MCSKCVAFFIRSIFFSFGGLRRRRKSSTFQKLLIYCLPVGSRTRSFYTVSAQETILVTRSWKCNDKIFMSEYIATAAACYKKENPRRVWKKHAWVSFVWLCWLQSFFLKYYFLKNILTGKSNLQAEIKYKCELAKK